MTANPITDDDLALLVHEFYGRVRQDAILGPIFNNAIGDWPEHLASLANFWSSVVLGSGRYKGRPMAAHLRHHQHMSRANFERWLGLWRETSEAMLGPERAAAVQEKAARIAESLQLGVEFHRDRLG